MTDLARVFTALARSLAAGKRLLLLTEYDGTLTPIVDDPTGAWLAREVRDDIAVLARSSSIRVGIVSGRRLDDLRVRVRLPEVIYAGCHGLEMEGPGLSFRHSIADAKRVTLAAIARALSGRMALLPGVLVEPKGLSVAVHYRNATRGAIRRLEAELDTLVRGAPGVEVLQGRDVVEILPSVGWNKGRCALRIRDHVRATAPSGLAMVYLADDSTDELAFWALDRRAITVRVGGGADTRATYGLRNVEDVQRLLSALAAEVGERSHA
jgi:trehalose 6-phosphate phosphatase